MKLKESLDSALNFTKTDDTNDRIQYSFNLKEEFNLNLEINVIISFVGPRKSGVIINFNSVGSNDLSTEKKASFAIFATLVDILNEVNRHYDVKYIQAHGDTLKKGHIYEKLFERFADENWEVDRKGTDVNAQKKDKL
jgi:hypothetical protein